MRGDGEIDQELLTSESPNNQAAGFILFCRPFHNEGIAIFIFLCTKNRYLVEPYTIDDGTRTFSFHIAEQSL
jgi:hypothetical protein